MIPPITRYTPVVAVRLLTHTAWRSLNVSQLNTRVRLTVLSCLERALTRASEHVIQNRQFVAARSPNA